MWNDKKGNSIKDRTVDKKIESYSKLYLKGSRRRVIQWKHSPLSI